MTDFSPEQVAALKAPLARENIKEREQAGRKLSYIEGWVAINEANRIFGFDGWDRETVECRCVSERESKIGLQQRDGWRVSYIAKVRVTVRPNTEVEDVALVRREGTGYGSGIDVDLGAAHESAIKEAETDAMKRALMTFGNPFGLALYDKAQTEVEPASRSPRNGAANAGTAPGNGVNSRAPMGGDQASSSAGHGPIATIVASRSKAETFRGEMKARFARCKIPADVETLIANNARGLEVVKKDAPDIYAEIMTDATNCKNEMYASA